MTLLRSSATVRDRGRSLTTRDLPSSTATATAARTTTMHRAPSILRSRSLDDRRLAESRRRTIIDSTNTTSTNYKRVSFHNEVCFNDTHNKGSSSSGTAADENVRSSTTGSSSSNTGTKSTLTTYPARPRRLASPPPPPLSATITTNDDKRSSERSSASTSKKTKKEKKSNVTTKAATTQVITKPIPRKIMNNPLCVVAASASSSGMTSITKPTTSLLVLRRLVFLSTCKKTSQSKKKMAAVVIPSSLVGRSGSSKSITNNNNNDRSDNTTTPMSCTATVTSSNEANIGGTDNIVRSSTESTSLSNPSSSVNKNTKNTTTRMALSQSRLRQLSAKHIGLVSTKTKTKSSGPSKNIVDATSSSPTTFPLEDAHHHHHLEYNEKEFVYHARLRQLSAKHIGLVSTTMNTKMKIDPTKKNNLAATWSSIDDDDDDDEISNIDNTVVLVDDTTLCCNTTSSIELLLLSCKNNLCGNDDDDDDNGIDDASVTKLGVTSPCGVDSFPSLSLVTSTTKATINDDDDDDDDDTTVAVPTIPSSSSIGLIEKFGDMLCLDPMKSTCNAQAVPNEEGVVDDDSRRREEVTSQASSSVISTIAYSVASQSSTIVDSMVSAVPNNSHQDETNMFQCTKHSQDNVLQDKNVILDQRSSSIKSEMTANTDDDDNDDVNYQLGLEGWNFTLPPDVEQVLDDNNTTYDCNYGYVIDDAYEKFGIERKFIGKDNSHHINNTTSSVTSDSWSKGRKLSSRLGSKLFTTNHRLFASGNQKIIYPPRNLVDVDEVSVTAKTKEISIDDINPLLPLHGGNKNWCDINNCCCCGGGVSGLADNSNSMDDSVTYVSNGEEDQITGFDRLLDALDGGCNNNDDDDDYSVFDESVTDSEEEEEEKEKKETMGNTDAVKFGSLFFVAQNAINKYQNWK